MCFWYRLFTAGDTLIGKSHLHYFVTLFIFLLSLLVRKSNQKLAENLNKWPIKSTIILYGFFAIYGAISVLWADSRLIAFTAVLEYFVTGLSIISVAILITDEFDFVFSCKVCLFNVIITCVLALYEIHTGQYIFELTSAKGVLSWIYFGFHSPIAQYNHPNNLAAALVLSLPFCIVAINYKKKNVFITASLLAAIVVILLVCNSRLSIAVLVVEVLSLLLAKKELKKKTRIYLGLFFVIIILMAVFFDDLYRNLSELTDGEARPLIWANAFSNAIKANLFGVGAGNAAIVNAKTARAGFIGRPCHNYALEVFEEFGVIGLSLFIYWYYSIFNKLRSCKGSVIRSILNVFLIIFIPMTIEQSSLLGSQTVWMYFGLVISYITLQSSAESLY